MAALYYGAMRHRGIVRCRRSFNIPYIKVNRVRGNPIVPIATQWIGTLKRWLYKE